MKVEIVPYKAAHAYDVLLRNIEEKRLQIGLPSDWEKTINEWKESGPAYTLIVDGQIVGCAGVILLGGHKGEAWSILSSLIFKNKKALFRAMRDNLEKIMKEKSLLRVQATVFKGVDQGCHLLKHLGFENETPEGMKKFGPSGETVFLFART